MPQVKRPRRGSLAFYPRKRAKRIYPNISTYPSEEKPKVLAFAGYKAGMTHVIAVDNKKGSPTFGQQVVIPATILDCPPIKVVGLRAYQKTVKGLKVFTEAWTKDLQKELGRKIKIGKMRLEEKISQIDGNLEKISNLRLIVATQPRISGLKKKTPEVFEIEISGKEAKEKIEFAKQFLGKEIPVKDVVKEGELVDAIGVTIGKGTAGPVKRFGIRIQNRHAKQKRRHVGAIAAQVPRRVLFTAPLAGQLGFQTRTELNKRVLKIGDGAEISPSSGIKRYGLVKGSYVLLAGSVPGPKKRLIFLRSPIRPQKVKLQIPEIREVVK